MASHPVQLASGAWLLPTLGSNLINCFAFEASDSSLVLVDAGLKSAPSRLVPALRAIGHSPEQVSTIILTHGHPDHQGGAAEMRAMTGAAVLVHEDDKPFVEGGRLPPPDPAQRIAKLLGGGSRRQPACHVDRTFVDGELLPGGLRAIHTPGHTPGHAAFLHEVSGVLLCGDAIFNLFDHMGYSWAPFCADYALSKDTADRLGEVEYEVAAFAHGPEIRAGARDAVRSFLRKRRSGAPQP